MATEFVVMLPGTLGQFAELALTALEQLDRIENLLSVYRPNSDIARLNHAAGQGPVQVADETIEVLARAVELSVLTCGAFDVTAGPLVDAWGFTKRRGQKPSAAAIAAALEIVGYQKLRIDVDAKSVELLQTGMTVNLGAIGKGFALDRIADLLRSGGASDFLVHGGNSSVLAAGDDVPGSDSGWKVAIEHPRIPRQRVGGLVLKNQSLGTSGSGKQFFHHQGKRLGHVIDPRTGWPAGEMLSLTVVCASAVDADALATGLFVMGMEDAVARSESWRDELGEVGMVAVLPTPNQAGAMVRCSGLRDQGWIEAN